MAKTTKKDQEQSVNNWGELYDSTKKLVKNQKKVTTKKASKLKTNLEDYEKAYLKRVKKEKNEMKDFWAKKSKLKETEHYEEALEPLDYMVLGLIRNGIRKYQTLAKRLSKSSIRKINSSFDKLMKSGHLKNSPDDTWKDRNFNPTLVMTDKGKQETEKKIDEMKKAYDKLVLLYEKKDKKKLREAMDSNRMNFPFMLMMGMTTGMMMGSMLSMNQMNMGDYFADMDYAYDMGYADGSGGAMPAEGGDFADGGGEGGFMDGGIDVGF